LIGCNKHDCKLPPSLLNGSETLVSSCNDSVATAMMFEERRKKK
jgi:hypothetical protein